MRRGTSRPVGEPRRGPRTAVPEQLVAALLGADLPGAACRGTAPLHDGDIAGEPEPVRTARHAAAVSMCTSCAAAVACRAAVSAAPPGLSGVWAGRVLGAGGRPRRAAS